MGRPRVEFGLEGREEVGESIGVLAVKDDSLGDDAVSNVETVPGGAALAFGRGGLWERAPFWREARMRRSVLIRDLL